MLNTRFSGLTGLILLSILTFSSCAPEENTPTGAYAEGVFFINEGSFGQGNGSITHLNPTTQTLTQDIIGAANNGLITGDIVQDLQFSTTKAFVVVNNGNRILVLEKGSFVLDTILTSRPLPRYLFLDQGTAYLTQWVSFGAPGNLVKINLSDYSMTDSIVLGELPEQMLPMGNDLWVINSNEEGDKGCMRIQRNPLQMLSQTDVGDRPNSMVKDEQGRVWILAGGRPSWAGSPTPGSLTRMNADGTVAFTLTLPDSLGNPTRLTWLGNSRVGFLANQGVYTYNINDANASLDLLIPGMGYGLAAHPGSGQIYVADAGNFSQAGTVKLYNAQGQFQQSWTAGVGVSQVIFQP